MKSTEILSVRSSWKVASKPAGRQTPLVG